MRHAREVLGGWLDGFLFGLACGVVVFLGQLSEDLGLFGHAVWYDHGKNGWRFACYAGIVVIVELVYLAGKRDGRRR